MADVQALLAKMATYGRLYEADFLTAVSTVARLIGRPRDFDSVAAVGQEWLRDPLLALAFAPWYSYAGHSLPGRHWWLVAQAIKETAHRVGMYNGVLPEETWRRFKQLCNRPANMAGDAMWRGPVGPSSKGPLVQGLTYLHLNHENLMAHIRDMLMKDARKIHFAIKASVPGMGDKTTSFLLRDVAWVYDLEGQHSLAELGQAIYIQPVDIWIRRLAGYLWPELRGKRDWKVIARRIVVECRRAHISPNRFNQGAWYFGVYRVKTADQFNERLMALGATGPGMALSQAGYPSPAPGG